MASRQLVTRRLALVAVILLVFAVRVDAQTPSGIALAVPYSEVPIRGGLALVSVSWDPTSPRCVIGYFSNMSLEEQQGDVWVAVNARLGRPLFTSIIPKKTPAKALIFAPSQLRYVMFPPLRDGTIVRLRTYCSDGVNNDRVATTTPLRYTTGARLPRLPTSHVPIDDRLGSLLNDLESVRSRRNAVTHQWDGTTWTAFATTATPSKGVLYRTRIGDRTSFFFEPITASR